MEEKKCGGNEERRGGGGGFADSGDIGVDDAADAVRVRVRVRLWPREMVVVVVADD
jgi:hypothetical protein